MENLKNNNPQTYKRNIQIVSTVSFVAIVIVKF